MEARRYKRGTGWGNVVNATRSSVRVVLDLIDFASTCSSSYDRSVSRDLSGCLSLVHMPSRISGSAFRGYRQRVRRYALQFCSTRQR